MLTSAGPAPASLLPLELLLKHDKPVPRYTSFPTAAAFHSGVGAEALATELATSSEAPLSIYVHVPFCRHACWYCGCHRITTQLLDRRRLIQNVMCRFQTKLALARYAKEWRWLMAWCASRKTREWAIWRCVLMVDGCCAPLRPCSIPSNNVSPMAPESSRQATWKHLKPCDANGARRQFR